MSASPEPVRRGDVPVSLPTVLFVSVPTGVGGSTRSLANVLTYLDGRARRVLAAPASGRFVGVVHEQRSVEGHLPIVSSARPLRPLRRAWTAVRLAAYALRHRRGIAAIHANGLKELSLALPAAFLSRVPLVVWVHNFLLPPSVRLLGGWWRRLLPRCDVRWAAVSALARQLVVDAGLVRAERVAIVPNPIDPADVLAPAPAGRRPGGPITVAYLGSPREYKGFQYLPDIIQASAELVEARWLVFSHQTDDHLAPTWERLRAMQAAGELSIEGKLTDVRRVYGRCDVVVCPSVLESFCRVAAEAMLNGIPVAGSDLAPIRELLGEDAAGLLFPAGDVAAAAKAIARLVEDPELRARLGEAGRRRARAYAPDAIQRQLLALYGLQETAAPVPAAPSAPTL
jgi:glycosyltransferase involved in cell wall biosynthesis